jgi:hypothetical protein
MGNEIGGFRRSLHEAYYPLTNRTLADCRLAYLRLESVQLEYGWMIGFSQFVEILELSGQAAAAAEMWKCFDDDLDGQNDVLEILSAMALVAAGDCTPKINLLFKMFDHHDVTYLTITELSCLIIRCVNGLAKLLMHPPVSLRALNNAAETIICRYGSEGPSRCGVSKAALVSWAYSSPEVLC